MARASAFSKKNSQRMAMGNLNRVHHQKKKNHKRNTKTTPVKQPRPNLTKNNSKSHLRSKSKPKKKRERKRKIFLSPDISLQQKFGDKNKREFSETMKRIPHDLKGLRRFNYNTQGMSFEATKNKMRGSVDKLLDFDPKKKRNGKKSKSKEKRRKNSKLELKPKLHIYSSTQNNSNDSTEQRKLYYRLNSDRKKSREKNEIEESSHLYNKLLESIKSKNFRKNSHSSNPEDKNSKELKGLFEFDISALRKSGVISSSRNPAKLKDYVLIKREFEDLLDSQTSHVRKSSKNIFKTESLSEKVSFQPFFTHSTTPKMRLESDLFSSVSYDRETYNHLKSEFSKKVKSKKNHSKTISKSISIPKPLESRNSTPLKQSFKFVKKSTEDSLKYNPFLSNSYAAHNDKKKSQKKMNTCYLYKQELLNNYHSGKPENSKRGKVRKIDVLSNFRSSNSCTRYDSYQSEKADIIVKMIKKSRSKSRDMNVGKEKLIDTILKKIYRTSRNKSQHEGNSTVNTSDKEVSFSYLGSDLNQKNSFDKKIVELFEQLIKENDRLNEQLKKQYSYRDRILSSFNLIKSRWKEDREIRAKYITLREEKIHIENEFENIKNKFKNLECRFENLSCEKQGVEVENLKLKKRLEDMENMRNIDEKLKSFQVYGSNPSPITEVSPEKELENGNEEEEKVCERTELEENKLIENFEIDVLKAYIEAQKEEFNLREQEYFSEIVNFFFNKKFFSRNILIKNRKF